MNRYARAVAVLCLIASAPAFAEVVRTKERAYVVTYSDNTAERYAVKWSLDVATKIRDEGSYVPYQYAPKSSGCSWSTTSTVTRTVSLMTRLGQTMPLENMSRTLTKDPATQGDLVAAGHRNEPCGKSKERLGEAEEAKEASLKVFDRLTDADLEDLKKQAQSNKDVAKITVQ